MSEGEYGLFELEFSLGPCVCGLFILFAYCFF